MTTSSNTYVVYLNGPAMGLGADDVVIEVTGTRIEADVNSSKVSVFNGDDLVAFFTQATGIRLKN